MSALADLRERIAVALGEIPSVVDGDWVVLDSPVDAVEPPAFLILIGPAAGNRRTMCTFDVQMEIVCIAARLTPEANYPVLELMIEGAVSACESAGLPPAQWLQPGPLEIAQITYLACRVQLTHPVSITMPEAPVPPVPGEAGWAWGELTPALVGGTTYLTVPGDPVFLPGPVANGMEYVTQQPGTVEAVRFWRHGSDPTPGRRIGMWWWQPDSQQLGHVTVSTDAEAGRTEGWVTVELDEPVRLAVADELHARFIVLAEIPDGSGFYFSPWTESQFPAVKHQRSRGRLLGQLGWPEWPPPDQYPSGNAVGVTIGDVIWTDVQYRPDT